MVYVWFFELAKCTLEKMVNIGQSTVHHDDDNVNDHYDDYDDVESNGMDLCSFDCLL